VPHDHPEDAPLETATPDGLGRTAVDVLDRAWEGQVQAAAPETRSAWLRAADALRDGGPDDKARARAVYWALRESLEPGDAADIPRILHVLRSGLERDVAFALLASRATASSDGRLRQAAQICVAQCQSVAGYFPDAEARLREVLSEVRGSGTRLERTAFASLAVVYQNQGREFEALLLTRIVVRLSAQAEDPWEACVAHQQYCAMLDALGDWDQMDDALDQLAAALQRADPPWAWKVLRYIHGERAEAALERGDFETARHSVAAMESAVPAGSEGLAVPEWRPVLLARLALEAGRPAAALSHLAGLAGNADGRAQLERVRAHFALGQPEEALRAGEVLMGRLAAEREVWGGAARRLHTSASLASLFEDNHVDAQQVHRAYDIAAEAAMRRIFELEHSLKTLPDLAAVGAEDMASLASFRVRFRERHARLLARLAPYLQFQLEADGPFAVNEGHLRVCAWCYRIASRASQWLPVGHLLPSQAGVPVTHTICPECVTAHGFG
jgi:tetratricopeptide (TPR) repeat protein